MTVKQAKSFFKDTFNIDFSDYRDEVFSRTENAKVNPFLFDDFLHTKHGNYEDMGLSMQEVLTLNYGHKVCTEIKRLCT